MKKLMLAVVLAAASVAVAEEFKAGFARVDITPPLGNFMPGYYKDRFAKEVLDPLQINMVAFSDGRTTALVAQYDTEGISDMVADRMRDAIVKAIKPAKIQNIYSTLIDGHAKSVQTKRFLTADDAIHNLALCAAAHESAKKGGKVVSVRD